MKEKFVLTRPETKLSRRTLLASAVAIGAVRPPDVGAATLSAPTMVQGAFSIASVGDLILAHPAADRRDLQPVFEILRKADIATANCELVINDHRTNPLAFVPPSHLMPTLAGPPIAVDIRNMGIDLVSRANNQTMWYGAEGMRATGNWLDKAGVGYAGSGETRSLARAPRYVETPQGRVAMVSMMAQIPTDAWNSATDPSGAVPANPGVNALRMQEYFPVTADEMAQLRAMRELRATDVRAASSMGDGGDFIPMQADELRLYGARYHLGDLDDIKRGVRTFKAWDQDVEGNLASIREARRYANFVTVQMHASEPNRPATSDFLVDFARQAIDAGADIFAIHGCHELRGIEIYKGKPIYYSLGNFFWALEQARQPVPLLSTERRGVDRRNYSESDLLNAESPSRFSPESYDSAIAVANFSAGKLRDVRIYPLDLGAELNMANRGMPRIASPAKSREILENLQEQSRQFGTSIEIRGATGIISV